MQMADRWQQGGPFTSDSRVTTGDRTDYPFWSFKNYTSMDGPKCIINRANKNTDINQIIMGIHSNIRSYTKVRRLVLHSVINQEVSRITNICHNYVPAPMPLVIISFPMCHAESFRSILQYPKRHCIRTPITTWPKQRNYLLDTGEEAHLCYNGPQKYIYYQKSPYEIFDRGSQARDRVFIIVLCQQLPSLIPVYHPFLDLPQMEIHKRK